MTGTDRLNSMQRVAHAARRAADRITGADAQRQRDAERAQWDADAERIQQDTADALQRLRDTHTRIDALDRMADLARRRADYWRGGLGPGDQYCDGYAHGYFDALSEVHAGKPEALAACGICTFRSHRNRGTHHHLDGHKYHTIG